MTTTNITTSAASQDVGIDSGLVMITTSGSGADKLNVSLPTLDANGFNGNVGAAVVLMLGTLSAAGDAVQLTFGGQTQVTVLNQMSPARMLDGVSLAFAGSGIVLQWDGYEWCANTDFMSGFASTPVPQNFSLSPVVQPASGVPGLDLNLQGGYGTDTKGGSLRLIAGQALNGDPAGDVILDPRGYGAGAPGNVLVRFLPTADPHVVDALWNNSGVLTISAG